VVAGLAHIELFTDAGAECGNDCLNFGVAKGTV
jgi:hypothetical protein